jgi:tetratricopeptide (TPR) repeat protein
MRMRAIAVLCFFGVIALAQNVDRPTSIVEPAKVSPEADLMAKYDNEVKASPRSSIAHFRIAEIYFQRHNYQSAANEFREALNGDLQPRWVEVWAHVNLGKIFDITGQRDRAINEYHQAQRTKDDTRGAQDEAETYLQFPYPQD